MALSFTLQKRVRQRPKTYRNSSLPWLPSRLKRVTFNGAFSNWAGKIQVYGKAAFERVKWQEDSLMGRKGNNVKNL